MRQRLVFACFLILTASCAAADDSNNNAVVTPTLPTTPPAKMAVPSIASVLLNEDCPDPKPAEAKELEQGSALENRSNLEDSDGPYSRPCSQSFVQIAFHGQGKTAAKTQLKEIRLQSNAGKTLAIIEARLPMRWKSAGYQPWNETITPETDLKTSYKLTVPNWTKVEKSLGTSSFGPSFRLEIDVTIGTETKTIQSSQFVRVHPEVIVT